MRLRSSLLAAALVLHRAAAILPDGLLVPFTSKLPACASLCGPLSDVQGGCVPPVVPSPDQKCFCGDARLSSMAQGTDGVTKVCSTTAGCSTDQLQMIQGWYQSYCGGGSGSSGNSNQGAASGNQGSSSTTSTTSSSSSKSQPAGGPWIKTHWRWLVMFICVFGGLALITVGCWFWRRSYLRKREAERLLRAPAATLQSPSPIYGGHAKDFGSTREKLGPQVTSAPASMPL